MKTLFTAIALLAPLAGSPLAAQTRHNDQDDAYRARQAGTVMSLREIEAGVVPAMKAKGADYIGAELDAPTARYRLKFMRDGSVIWVDIDGRTGAVLGRAGD